MCNGKLDGRRRKSSTTRQKKNEYERIHRGSFLFFDFTYISLTLIDLNELSAWRSAFRIIYFPFEFEQTASLMHRRYEMSHAKLHSRLRKKCWHFFYFFTFKGCQRILKTNRRLNAHGAMSVKWFSHAFMRTCVLFENRKWKNDANQFGVFLW